MNVTSVKLCLLEDCLEPKKTKGYCAKHYMWMKRHNSEMVYGKVLPCRTVDCDEPVSEAGLCREHFLEMRRHRDATKRQFLARDSREIFTTRHERDNRPIPDDLWEFVKYELGIA